MDSTLFGESERVCGCDCGCGCMVMWKGNDGEPVDELVENEPKVVVAVPGASESEDEGGSESP